jgi:beta-aspartyl-peptidase (threonine type)
MSARLALASLASFSAACRSGDTGVAPPNGGSFPADAEVRALLFEQQQAWNDGDIPAFMAAGYWRSPELTFFSGGEVSRGYDPMLERYQRRYEAPGEERGELTFTGVEVVPLSERVALVRGRWDLDFPTKPDAGGLFSLVVRRMSEGWRIVHDHTSSDG